MNTRTHAAILALSIICAQAGAATFQGLGCLDSSIQWPLSECSGVSDDGSVAYGSSHTSDGLLAFRWTASEGIQSLGDLPGGQAGSYAFDASYDGSVIVGTSYTTDSTGKPVHRACAWTKTAGMTELPLPEDPHYIYSSTCAFAVSADAEQSPAWRATRTCCPTDMATWYSGVWTIRHPPRHSVRHLPRGSCRLLKPLPISPLCSLPACRL
jgi:hypothetical protein